MLKKCDFVPSVCPWAVVLESKPDSQPAFGIRISTVLQYGLRERDCACCSGLDTRDLEGPGDKKLPTMGNWSMELNSAGH